MTLLNARQEIGHPGFRKDPGPSHDPGTEGPGFSLRIAEVYQKETESSCTDNLTGLFTHGFFHLLLENEINRSKRYASSFTLGFIDIDRFSMYNQQHGSLKGDQLLREFANVVRKNIRKVDVAARYGGDIVAVLFPETDPSQAEPALARILKQLEDISEQTITASAGFAAFPSGAETKNRVILKANEALREAKINGRNRSFGFQAETMLPEEIETESPLVLVVDDEPLNREMMAYMLERREYRVLQACNGAEALKIVHGNDIDLIFMDVMMPVMDGFEACRRIKTSSETRMIPVVLLTALDDLDSRVKGIEAGADEFITRPPNKMELLARAASLVKVKKLNDSLTSIENVLFALANAVDIKDHYTQGHIQRVSDLAAAMGRRKGMSQARINALRFGGVLHDIGKIGIPETILNKEGRLTDAEWIIMKTHPEMGYSICLPLERILGPALGAMRHHHEKLDGTGYPDGLKDDAISIEARILAVADIYDALTTDRRYRKAMSPHDAVAILREEAADGKLDINIVEDLVGIIDLKETMEPASIDCSQNTSTPSNAETAIPQLGS